MFFGSRNQRRIHVSVFKKLKKLLLFFLILIKVQRGYFIHLHEIRNRLNQWLIIIRFIWLKVFFKLAKIIQEITLFCFLWSRIIICQCALGSSGNGDSDDKRIIFIQEICAKCCAQAKVVLKNTWVRRINR